jgi:hypothetical protein
MFFKRIKAYLKARHEALFVAFEIAHFLVDLIIVIHIFMPHAGVIA